MVLGEVTVRVRLSRGEQDGMQFTLPADWDVMEPPLHTWVLPVQAERRLAEYVQEPPGLREKLTTCAYKYADYDVDPETDEIVVLHYERDESADLVPGADLHSS
jgi:hypothetical protein